MAFIKVLHVILSQLKQKINFIYLNFRKIIHKSAIITTINGFLISKNLGFSPLNKLIKEASKCSGLLKLPSLAFVWRYSLVLVHPKQIVVWPLMKSINQQIIGIKIC